MSSRMAAAAGVASMNEPRWSPPCSTSIALDAARDCWKTEVDSGYNPYSSFEPTATSSGTREAATVKVATPLGISPDRHT